MVSVQGRLVAELEAHAGLDRALEMLPTRPGSPRWHARAGLTSPELATLLAHVKLDLKASILDSDCRTGGVRRSAAGVLPGPAAGAVPGRGGRPPAAPEIVTTC